MNAIDVEIRKHAENSSKLKKLSVGNDKINFKKSRELQKQQNEEWDKLIFLRNLKKELNKIERS